MNYREKRNMFVYWFGVHGFQANGKKINKDGKKKGEGAISELDLILDFEGETLPSPKNRKVTIQLYDWIEEKENGTRLMYLPRNTGAGIEGLSARLGCQLDGTCKCTTAQQTLLLNCEWTGS